MKNILKKTVVAVALVAALVGCERIQTGEVGIRINASRQVQDNELVPGSWNQTVFGQVLTFPVRDVVVELNNKNPITEDSTALSDFDITVVYNIAPGSVAELYSTKSKSFHAQQDGDIFLMYNYISTLVNNAAYKSVRTYKALNVADNREKIEQSIREAVTEQLKSERLDTSISVSVVQIRSILPNAEILKSATDYVRAQNELRVKETEVKIAEKESERMAALANNSGQSIAYMQAQSQLMIAEAVKNGKVNTIIIPHNLTMLGSLPK